MGNSDITRLYWFEDKLRDIRWDSDRNLYTEEEGVRCPDCMRWLSWDFKEETRISCFEVRNTRPGLVQGCILHRSLVEEYTRIFPNAKFLDIQGKQKTIRSFVYVKPAHTLQWDEKRSHPAVQTRCRRCYCVYGIPKSDPGVLYGRMMMMRRSGRYFPPQIFGEGRYVYRDHPPSPSGIYRSQPMDLFDERYVEFALRHGRTMEDFCPDQIFEIRHDLPREGNSWIVNSDMWVRPEKAPEDALGTTWEAAEAYVEQLMEGQRQ